MFYSLYKLERPLVSTLTLLKSLKTKKNKALMEFTIKLNVTNKNKL